MVTGGEPRPGATACLTSAAVISTAVWVAATVTAAVSDAMMCIATHLRWESEVTLGRS